MSACLYEVDMRVVVRIWATSEAGARAQASQSNGNWYSWDAVTVGPATATDANPDEGDE